VTTEISDFAISPHASFMSVGACADVVHHQIDYSRHEKREMHEMGRTQTGVILKLSDKDS
jgi:hypothetical protein